jgi:hypothetical protein
LVTKISGVANNTKDHFEGKMDPRVTLSDFLNFKVDMFSKRFQHVAKI